MKYADALPSKDYPSLRSCPFCGSGNIEVCIVDEAYCMCCDCGAYGPGAEIDYAAHEGNEDAAINEAYDAAIVLWNRRYDNEMPL